MQPEVCKAEYFWIVLANLFIGVWGFFLGLRLSASCEMYITVSPEMSVLTLREQNVFSEHFQVNHNQFASLN